MPPPAARPCQRAAETPDKLTEEMIPVQHTASSFTSLDSKLFGARRVLGR